MSAKRYELGLIWKRGSRELERVSTTIDPRDDGAMRAHLLAALDRQHQPARKIRDYTLAVYAPRNRRPIEIWSP